MEYILIIIVVSIIGLILCSIFWLGRYRAPQIIGEAILNVPMDEKIIALTFDDGPNPPFTAHILELLTQHNARATFFVIGQNAQKYPDIVRETFQRGNELGNHSWDHSRLVFESPCFIKKQIDSTDEMIRSVGYQGSIYFRAPYAKKLLVLPFLLWKTSRQHILFNIAVGDWNNLVPERMLEVLDERLTNGSIVLLHDGDGNNVRDGDCRNTVALVKLILERYTTEGYKFVTISELLSCRAGE